MWKQLTTKSNVPLLIQKFTNLQKLDSHKIPEGFSIRNCTSFSIYLKNVNNIIHKTTREQDEQRPKPIKNIQQVYEIHRQILQYVQDVLQHFMDEFNKKFDKFYVSGEQDVQLHLLEFNGSDTFTLIMRTQNKPLMHDGIIFWKMMITQLQEALKQQNICILSCIYLGEVCVNFYESKENIIDFYLFGSAINGSIRGCKLSKELDLQLNLLLHKEYAINFQQKTSLFSYMLKKNTSNFKVTYAAIQSSFFIIPLSTIKDLEGIKYKLNPLYVVLNEIKQHNHKIPSQSNIKNLEQTQETNNLLKTLSENKEGFEGATIIKLVFSITNNQSKINQQQVGGKDSKLGLSSEQQQFSGQKKQNREISLEGVDWEEERMNIKIKLQEIMNQIQELVAILNIQYLKISHCSFQNLLTTRLIIRNKIDHSSRTALFISVMKQFQLTNLKKVKASSQLFFFYILFIKGYETQKRQQGFDQIQRGNVQSNTLYDIVQQGLPNIYDTVSLHYLRDRKVNYLKKSDGIFKYNMEILNFYFRENPSNMLSFKSHWNPILNHCLSYQNASIFQEKRSSIMKKLQDCINLSQTLQQTFQNEIILIEGDIGSGKSSFMQLLSKDIANTFQPGQCTVFTKSLRGFIMYEIKQRFLPRSYENNQRKKERRLFFNSFCDIILKQSIYHCNELQEQYLQTADSKQQKTLMQNIILILTLQTFLTEDQQKMQPKSLLIQNIQTNNSKNKQELQIDDKMRSDLVQLGYQLLIEYLHSLKIKLIIFMIDDLQYQDKWSWQVMKKISQSNQKDFKIIILSTFRFHLPSEMNEDISTYTCIEPKIIPMIMTSKQLFENNFFLNEKILDISSKSSIRISLNSITVSDQHKLLIEAIQLFYACKVDQEQSKEAINFILLQLFRRNKCNNPLKILYLIHMICKSSFILIYEIDKEAGVVGKRLSQLSFVHQNDGQSIQDTVDPISFNQAQKQNENLKKVFIGINENFQNIENTIFESQIESPMYFSNMNNAFLLSLLQENEVITTLLPKQKYFIVQSNKPNLQNQFENNSYNIPENYLKDCKPVEFKNRSNLVWQSLSLLGDKFNINKAKFYLKSAFQLPDEQVFELISDMYIYRLILMINNIDEKDYKNQIQQSQNKSKKSLNLIQQSNNDPLISKKSEKQDDQQNSSQTQSERSQNKLNQINFQFNDNMFFLFKQSIQQQISLRVMLLLHKSYFDIMIELLQMLIQKNSTNTQEFAELYMELIHHNCKYSSDKLDTVLKKISPQITYFFRKNILFYGEAYKFSSKHKGFIKCQLKLNPSSLFIFKDEEYSQNQLPSQKNLENQSIIEKSQRDKTQSHFFSQINQIKQDLMISTNRFQNIQSIWKILKYDYTYQLFLEKQMIKIHINYLTKHKELGDRIAQNKAIALTFSNPSAYYTFYMGLRYLQIEPYNPEFCYEKKENYSNTTYLIQFPLLKSLPKLFDPLQKTDLFKSLNYSKISQTAQNLYFLYINNDYLKRLPCLQQLKKGILEFIPLGIFSLQQQIINPMKSKTHVAYSPTKSVNSSQQKISSITHISDNNESPNKKSNQYQQQKHLQNSNLQFVQLSQNNSSVLEKTDKNLNSSNQYIEPLQASRVRDNHENKIIASSAQKKEISTYEGNLVENQSMQEKLFELKILNENQPETGKFNNIEGINQDNFINQTNKISNQNPNEDTETFRKKSEQFIGNIIDVSTYRNHSNSLTNNKRLQVIQEEEQKYQNVSQKPQVVNNIQNKSLSTMDRQDSGNDIFEQIESERAQYNDKLYQEQLEISMKLNQNTINQRENRELRSEPIQNQKFLINNSNQVYSPSLPGSLYSPNTHNQDTLHSLKHQNRQDIRNQQNNEYTNQYNNQKSKIEKINDSTSLIKSETNRQHILSNQNQNMQKLQYFNEQTPQLYQLPVIDENGLLTSKRYDQIQKKNQQPIEMSIQSIHIPDIEEEENPFQIMNGLKVLQIQQTPILSATKSRSISPFVRDTQTHSSITPLSQYSAHKQNLVTSTKQLIQKQETLPKVQQNILSDKRQQNLSGQNIRNTEQNNQQKNTQNNNQYHKNQILQTNESEKDLQNFIQIQKYEQLPNQIQQQKQSEQHVTNYNLQQIPFQSKSNLNQNTSLPSKQQTLDQTKFQQDLQTRLEQVRINQQEFQKETQQIESENSKNTYLNNTNKELQNKQSQHHFYQQRYTTQGIDQYSSSNRSDLIYFEDEKQQIQGRKQNEGNTNQLSNNLANIEKMNTQVIKSSSNHPSNSKNISRIISSEFMQSINDQPAQKEYSEQNQNLNTRNNLFQNQNPNNNSLKIDKNDLYNIFLSNQTSKQSIQNQRQPFEQQQKQQNFYESKDLIQPNTNFEQKYQQPRKQELPNQQENQKVQSSLNTEKRSNQQQYSQQILPTYKSHSSKLSSIQNSQRNLYSPISDQSSLQNNIFNKNSIIQYGQKPSLNKTEEQIMQNSNTDYNQTAKIVKPKKSLSPFNRDNSPNQQIQTNQNVSNQQNQSIKQPQFQQNNQSLYLQQQLQTSATKVVSKQNEIIQKKRDSLKKYLCQNQNSVEGISILQDEERNSLLNSEATLDQEMKNTTLQMYIPNGKQFISNQFSSIYSSKVGNDEDSYIGIVIKQCNSFKGDRFQVKQDDCVIVKFIDDNCCEVHYEGKIGCVPKQNIKIIQKAQQFLVNLNNFNQRKQKDLNDTTLNNVHKILTDIDK